MRKTKDDWLLYQFGNTPRSYVYPTTFDKDKPLETFPHYTDNRFEEEQTVFGRKEEGLGYNYSDRLWEWDYNKSKQAYATADESGLVKNSCRYFEAYLSAYFGRPIEIGHIVAGVNHSNGHPYCVFGYRDAK